MKGSGLAERKLSRAFSVYCGGLLLIALGLAVALAGRSVHISGPADTPVQVPVGTIGNGDTACQPHVPLPDGTRGLRLSLSVANGQKADVQVVKRGAAGAWTSVSPGTWPAVPLARAQDGDGLTRICLRSRGPGQLTLLGAQTGPRDQIRLVSAQGRVSNAAGRIQIQPLVSVNPQRTGAIVSRLPERVATATGQPLAPWLAGGGLVVGVLATGLLLSRREDVDEH